MSVSWPHRGREPVVNSGNHGARRTIRIARQEPYQRSRVIALYGLQEVRAGSAFGVGQQMGSNRLPLGSNTVEES